MVESCSASTQGEIVAHLSRSIYRAGREVLNEVAVALNGVDYQLRTMGALIDNKPCLPKLTMTVFPYDEVCKKTYLLDKSLPIGNISTTDRRNKS